MIYSFSCARTAPDPKQYAGNLAKQDISRTHDFLVGKSSIFEAYNQAYKFLNTDSYSNEDVLIFCHDDIEVWDDPKLFKEEMLKCLNKPKTGFAGVAGTTVLPQDCVWWEMERRRQGLHSGFCFQGNNRNDFTPNYFGPPNDVVVLDGLFLAAKLGTLREVFPNGIEQPKEFPGSWDFYDLWMTLEAHKKGFVNRTFPGILLHKSPGSLVGRDSWTKNREAFQKMNAGKFPFVA